MLSMPMISVHYRQRSRNVCTEHYFEKNLCKKISGRIFYIDFVVGRVFRVCLAMWTNFHRTDFEDVVPSQPLPANYRQTKSNFLNVQGFHTF